MEIETQAGPTSGEPVQAFSELQAEAAEVQDEQSSGAEAETAEAEAPETATAEQAETETADDEWLPEVQKKVYSEDDLQRAAQKYRFTEEELAQPGAQQRLKFLLDKDIYIRNLQSQLESNQPEETEEEPEPATSAQPQSFQPPTPEQVQSYIQTVESNAKAYINPQVGQHFGQKIGTVLLKTFGVDPASSDPQVKALVASVSKAAPELTSVLAEMALAFNTTLIQDPQYAQAVVKYGMGDSYQSLQETQAESQQQRAWNEALSSDPALVDLPKAGTPEWEDALAQVQEAFPSILKTVFTDDNGKPLPRYQQYVEKSRFAAKYLASQKASPKTVEQVKQATETGRKLERQAITSKQAGRLGVGQSKGAFQPGQQENPLRDAIMSIRRAENPFAGKE